jgi:hypothetical protein
MKPKWFDCLLYTLSTVTSVGEPEPKPMRHNGDVGDNPVTSVAEPELKPSRHNYDDGDNSVTNVAEPDLKPPQKMVTFCLNIDRLYITEFVQVREIKARSGGGTASNLCNIYV